MGDGPELRGANKNNFSIELLSAETESGLLGSNPNHDVAILPDQHYHCVPKLWILYYFHYFQPYFSIILEGTGFLSYYPGSGITEPKFRLHKTCATVDSSGVDKWFWNLVHVRIYMKYFGNVRDYIQNKCLHT